ncbi:putative membrane insertase YidC/ALB3/OXA1/COX18 [Helianthus debilis subsp. tardiflorus]
MFSSKVLFTKVYHSDILNALSLLIVIQYHLITFFYHQLRFTNNVLSTAQQVWLRKLGGAKPVVNENASGIISAGQAKRSSSQPSETGARFKQLKEEEKRKSNKALPGQDIQVLASTSDTEDETDEETKSTEVLEEAYASSTTKQVPESGPRRSKRSKKKRSV